MDVVVSEGTHSFLLFESRGAQLAWCQCEECFARRSNPEGTRTQRRAAARDCFVAVRAPRNHNPKPGRRQAPRTVGRRLSRQAAWLSLASSVSDKAMKR